MLRAFEVGPFGPVIVYGLTFTNLDRLAAGRPIRNSSAQLGVRPAFEVWILGGPTLGSISEDLAAVGVTVADSLRRGDGLLVEFLHWDGLLRAAGGPTVPVAVVGISAHADRVLRNGAELYAKLPGGRPGIRLLAASDSDQLVSTVTAGKPVKAMLDARGGRTD